MRHRLFKKLNVGRGLLHTSRNNKNLSKFNNILKLKTEENTHISIFLRNCNT